MKYAKSFFVVAILILGIALSGMFTKKDQGGSVVSAKKEQTAQQLITVEGGNFYFSPNEIRAKKGQPMQILLNNKEGIHDFVIKEFGVGSDTISGGQTTTISFTPDKAGTFEFYCSIGQHRDMGMKGTLIVEE